MSGDACTYPECDWRGYAHCHDDDHAFEDGGCVVCGAPEPPVGVEGVEVVVRNRAGRVLMRLALDELALLARGAPRRFVVLVGGDNEPDASHVVTVVATGDAT